VQQRQRWGAATTAPGCSNDGSGEHSNDGGERDDNGGGEHNDRMVSGR